MLVPIRFLRSAALEYLEHDATLFRSAVAIGGAVAGGFLWPMRDKSLAFRILSRVHRAGGSRLATGAIERLLARTNRLERSARRTGLWAFYEDHVRRAVDRPESANIVRNPKSLLGYRVLVLKSARGRERGVIVMDYSYIFPLFAALFDVEAIARRYYLVLEPSWRGLCTEDVLSYSRFDFPVFVQTVEPRDIEFLEAVGANFVTVPIAANWWVDHRLVKPDHAVRRDIDVIMVAAWSSLKRHWRFFRVLADLRARGHKFKVALVGYPADRSRGDIEDEARYFGVFDQMEVHEQLPLSEVGRLLARSKAHVLWSRKEGANRAIVEAMLADVPIIVRKGLSYGYQYPYVNSLTGRFVSEPRLGDALLEMVQSRNNYHPREWVMANMSCQQARQTLEDAIRRTAIASGEPWTSNLVVKTVHLETQRYWDPADRARFECDYAYLEGQLRDKPVQRIA